MSDDGALEAAVDRIERLKAEAKALPWFSVARWRKRREQAQAIEDAGRQIRRSKR